VGFAGVGGQEKYNSGKNLRNKILTTTKVERKRKKVNARSKKNKKSGEGKKMTYFGTQIPGRGEERRHSKRQILCGRREDPRSKNRGKEKEVTLGGKRGRSLMGGVTKGLTRKVVRSRTRKKKKKRQKSRGATKVRWNVGRKSQSSPQLERGDSWAYENNSKNEKGASRYGKNARFWQKERGTAQSFDKNQEEMEGRRTQRGTGLRSTHERRGKRGNGSMRRVKQKGNC